MRPAYICAKDTPGGIQGQVEVTIRAERLTETLQAVKRIHPYEEPVINVIPLWGTGLDGRIIP